ncbi:MAG: hypothetical protein A3I39_03050 [Candidatus Yanofskybacteria bacterium RIFCSPLOWO2_02_FULL_47_9b]|uniref:Uncharacterized protein n=1 Tax=Candidatus Yanofskybacteria bacterium RIFCSPLOWO2_02_FULL_47_9b TaxID=1802708 RepID=A0A1F8H6H9_9BACT|nr:MAG: hypothetical protein A3I39_03050 [Candidatus Yanofskybacteria bacterium RIFCSPLOWO2_02_FULL_47_9b]
MESQLSVLDPLKLIAILFLVEEGAANLELVADFRLDSEKWEKTKRDYQRQIANYPDEYEEKHFLLATLEAVHGLDPHTERTRELLKRLGPLIQRLATLP